MSAASDLRKAIREAASDYETVNDEVVDAILDAVIAALPIKKELELNVEYSSRVHPSDSDYFKGQKDAINAVREFLQSAKTQKGEE